MLDPEVNLRLIAPKRRNTGNPWFKRGMLYRAVVDTLRRATGPMTADDICQALLAGKTPPATSRRTTYRRPSLRRCGSGTGDPWLAKECQLGGG
jgi:hypothetical protein